MNHPAHLRPRWPVSVGALLAGLAVALSAYASHAVDGSARANLLTAAAFAFGHGVALIALAGTAARRIGAIATALLLAGVLMFSGALVAKSLFGASSAIAPYGGSLLMLGWLLHAIDAWRR